MRISFIVIILMVSNVGQSELANYQRIEMSKISTGHDVVSVMINDTEGLFIVDTAAISLINDSRLENFGISRAEKIRTFEAAGAGGAVLVDLYPVQTIKLEGFGVSNSNIGSTDLDTVTAGLFNTTGYFIDGLIGQDILVDSAAIIDIVNQHLYIKQSTFFESSTTKNKLFQSDHLIKLEQLVLPQFNLNFMTISLQINGIHSKLILDSGAGRSMLNSNALKKLNLDKRKPLSVQGSSGAGGSFGIANIEVSSIKSGSYELAQSTLFHTDLSAVVKFVEKHTGELIDGVLGQDILQRHQAVIDVGAGKLYLQD